MGRAGGPGRPGAVPLLAGRGLRHRPDPVRRRRRARRPLTVRGGVVAGYPRFDVVGQVALVTGAARGLGRAVALALRGLSSDARLVAEIEATGRQVVPVQCEVGDIGQVQAAVDAVVTRFGRLDVLVNNAGVAPGNDAMDVTEEDFDRTVAVNLKGTFFASQAAGRVMAGQGGGRIVNMGSQAGAVALPGESVYCMTKAAIAHLPKCLAVAWGPHGITVNPVAP